MGRVGWGVGGVMVMVLVAIGGVAVAREQGFHDALGDEADTFYSQPQELRAALRRQWSSSANLLGQGGVGLEDATRLAAALPGQAAEFIDVVVRMTDRYEAGDLEREGLRRLYREARHIQERGRHDLSNGHIEGTLGLAHGTFVMDSPTFHTRLGDEEYSYTTDAFDLGQDVRVEVTGRTGFDVLLRSEVEHPALQWFVGEEFTWLRVAGQAWVEVTEDGAMAFDVQGTVVFLDLPMVTGQVRWVPEHELYAELTDLYVPMLPVVTNASLDLALIRWDLRTEQVKLVGQWTRHDDGRGAWQGTLESAQPFHGLLTGLLANRLANAVLEAAELPTEFESCVALEFQYGKDAGEVELRMEARFDHPVQIGPVRVDVESTVTFVEMHIDDERLRTRAPREMVVPLASEWRTTKDLVLAWQSAPSVLPVDLVPRARSCFAPQPRGSF